MYAQEENSGFDSDLENGDVIPAFMYEAPEGPGIVTEVC
jgi:hypothetical protein